MRFVFEEELIKLISNYRNEYLLNKESFKSEPNVLKQYFINQFQLLQTLPHSVYFTSLFEEVIKDFEDVFGDEIHYEMQSKQPDDFMLVAALNMYMEVTNTLRLLYVSRSSHNQEINRRLNDGSTPVDADENFWNDVLNQENK